MNDRQIKAWLCENNIEKLKELFTLADKIRKKNVGDSVHLRGLLEISNYCVRKCTYCGINIKNKNIERYRMNAEEIFTAAQKTEKLGYGTIVMQAGEDYGIKAAWLAEIIKKIKTETKLAVTLSLGERTLAELKMWREAGADRYLLRFETSNAKLYAKIHPVKDGEEKSDRIAILKNLRSLGYEIGSGIMIGIPGQSFDDLTNDILLFGKLDLDMIGVGPYILHPNTDLAKENFALNDEQVPNSEIMTYKMIALARIICPNANIPATTALATLNKSFGRENALTRGANVVMPNVTEPVYRMKYQLYPDKACINETAEECQNCMNLRIEAIGRHVGRGAGARKKS